MYLIVEENRKKKSHTRSIKKETITMNILMNVLSASDSAVLGNLEATSMNIFDTIAMYIYIAIGFALVGCGCLYIFGSEEGKMKAVISITFDDEFVVHDIKIIEGQNGPFIAMPSRKMGEGDFRDIAHPLNSETRNKIKDAIFAEYEKVLAEQPEQTEAE